MSRREPMLVVSRKPGEKVVIGEKITLTVVEMKGNQVRLAFDAPAQVRILRGELKSGKNQSETEEELADHDLAEKPAEWQNDVLFCRASTRRTSGCHGNTPAPTKIRLLRRKEYPFGCEGFAYPAGGRGC
jgi:carbon storage regulator